MKYVSILLCLMMVLFSCKKAEKYVSPTINPHLAYSAGQAGDLDGKGMSFTIPGHKTPLVDSGGDWSNPCDVIWLDGDRLVFVQDEDDAGEIHFLNVVSGKVYPCEDEIQHQEVRDAVRTHRLEWTRTTDRGKTGGQQMVNRMFTKSNCVSYDELKLAEIKSRDETQTAYLLQKRHYEARERQKAMSERVICEYRLSYEYCQRLHSRTDAQGAKLGNCPKSWVTLSRDGRYLLTDAGLVDLKASKYLGEGALVQQEPSTPPVVVAYAVNPAFDKVAVVYGYSDHYVVDVADLKLPGK